MGLCHNTKCEYINHIGYCTLTTCKHPEVHWGTTSDSTVRLREDEINLAINLIEQICRTSNIALAVAQKDGKAKMIIIDATTKKQYDIKNNVAS
jgi:hypothetical protein